MKRCYPIVFCVIFLLTGCAGWKIERKVENNVFSSSSRPKIAVNISPELDYIGKDEGANIGRAAHRSDISTPAITESYLFGDKNKDNQLQRGVLIQICTINKPRYYWLPDMFPDKEDCIVSDHVEFNSKEYQHAVKAVEGLFTKDKKRIPINKGYKLATNNYLCNCFARRSGGSNDLKMLIIYFEDISSISPRYSLHQWKNKRWMSEDQKILFKNFIERSRSSFTILAKNPVVDAKGK